MTATPSLPPFRRVRWANVATYYAIACAISWPLFWWRWSAPTSFASWQPPVPKNVLYMSGPGLAALICFVRFRTTHVRTVTLWGTSAARSLAAWLLPAVLLAGVYGSELHRDEGWGRLVGLMTLGFVATLGEELGWRGFLQDALRPLPRGRRYFLIGVLWEAWHFTTRWGDGGALGVVVRVAFAALVLIVLSWLIGELVDRTRSVVVAVTMHAWFNLALEASSALPGSPVRAWGALGASCLAWWWIVRTWPPAPPQGPGDGDPASTPLHG